MARGSPASAEICLRNLGRFCNINKLSPKQLTEMKIKSIEDLLMDYVSSVQAKHSGSYIHNTIKIVKSWQPSKTLVISHVGVCLVDLRGDGSWF
jgi:hypothetical protein